MKPLAPLHIDLEKTTLIEASAGTGKTYTITTLYCRLIAIGYPVESILVVTFTEAAAAELKLRIRNRLFKTVESLSKHSLDSDDELADFLGHQKDSDLILRRLQSALNCFDQTAIMTIHSFCLKILKENAFESQSFFDIELVPDRSLFLRQVCFDFFLSYVNNQDPLFLSYLNLHQITPESFSAKFVQIVSRPDLRCNPCSMKFENVFEEYRQVVKKIHALLLTGQEEIKHLISIHKGIDKRSYSKRNVPAWLGASLLKMDQTGENTLFKMTEAGDALYKFTRTRIELKTKEGSIPPEHAFFDLCERLFFLYEIFAKNLISLKLEFLAFYNSQLDRQKKIQGICFFDDLVNDLAAALEKKGSGALQKNVRQVFRACLIDEFQDTDPRQYDIFSTLFSSPGTPFFMIGDPKQAIYAFRGGDIFAYLKASQLCDQKFTLQKNYRSAPLLVTAINEVFAVNPNPFLYDAIEFAKVNTPKSAENTLIEKELPVAPLQFRFIKRDDHPIDHQGFISKETAFRMIPEIVAEDILSLLQSDKVFNKNDGYNPQKISPKDIAVLVRTNQQSEQIQTALTARNIPSYLSKSSSVFDSRQAIDLYDILWAVYDPDSRGGINAALCTSVFGFSSDMLLLLDKKEAQFFKWQDRFRAYKELWHSKGFVSMIMAVFHSETAFLDEHSNPGERGLTNFYHLIELISSACLKQQLTPYYLMKWYARQLSGELRDESEDELRLESDKEAVAIVTIHKSKGLEYPIVYLPYLWDGQQTVVKGDVLFHDPEKDHQLTLDLGSKDKKRAQIHFETEEKAEMRRLLYVALTRASAMCRIIWGGFKSVQSSALGSILHQDDCKDDAAMIHDLKQVHSHAPQSILIQPYTEELSNCSFDRMSVANPVLSVEKSIREIKSVWKMSSFSAVLHSSQNEPRLWRKTENLGKGALITLAHFPKGAGSGDFFHSIFESIDFTGKTEDIMQQVRLKARLFGFQEPDLIQMAGSSVTEVLNTSIAPDKTSDFFLQNIHPNQRFTEIEFAFPVQSFQMTSVIDAFKHSDSGHIRSEYLKELLKLTVQGFKGFIKGFIDLVIHHKGRWYIIDYKSNYLGNTYEQYSRSTISEAMAEHHYFLQYHLYLVALHRYLGHRLKEYDYEQHFGGVFYLFIRGMSPKFGSQYGVFFDRPKQAVIRYLSDNL